MTMSARARFTSTNDAGSFNASQKLNVEEVSDSVEEFSMIHRDAVAHFDKYDRSTIPELLACSSLDWMLSADEAKAPSKLCNIYADSHVSFDRSKEILLLLPCNWAFELDVREVHQILRELVIGIYVLNQVPALTLDVTHNHSTVCALTPAYEDTRIGQLMIDVDYHLKSLWAGCYFSPENRVKFAERWRTAVDLNPVTGEIQTKRSLQLIWSEAGLIDLSTKPEYRSSYEQLSKQQQSLPLNTISKVSNDGDKLCASMNLFQTNCTRSGNVLISDVSYNISCAHMISDEGQPNAEILQYLKIHQELIAKNVEVDKVIKLKIEYLKLVAFLVPLLLFLKKNQGSIPQLTNMEYPFSQEECRTSRELPPIVTFPDSLCQSFATSTPYHGLFGGVYFDRLGVSQFDPVSGPMLSIASDAVNCWKQFSDNCLRFPVTIKTKGKELPKINFGDQNYVLFGLQTEQFYGFPPMLPRWVDIYSQEIGHLLPRKLPLSANQIHERFRKYFGYQKTLKLKTLQQTLPAAVSLGLVDVVLTFCRRQIGAVPNFQDANGYSLLHLAATTNRPFIILYLIHNGCRVDVRRSDSFTTSGVTPAHVAARCGAVESLACLVALGADLFATDKAGFMPIHYAAAYNQRDCICVLLRHLPDLEEAKTLNKSKMTPILLASKHGAISAVEYLLLRGVNSLAQDSYGHTMIHLASLSEHADILKLFAKSSLPHISVWSVLTEMLVLGKEDYHCNACRCIDSLIVDNPIHWKALLDTGAVPALVDLLRSNDSCLHAIVVSIFCNISQHEAVCLAIQKEDCTSMLIERLANSNWDTMQSRICVILADIACCNEMQYQLAEEGCIEPTVLLLNSTVDHVLVNAGNLLRVLADRNMANQTRITNCPNVITLINKMLGFPSHCVQANAAACIAALARGHVDNQVAFVEWHSVELLVLLLKSKSSACQLSAATALQALANGNKQVQEAVDENKATDALIRMLKMWDVKTKEQGASTLWALAGETWERQIHVASLIGIHMLIDIMMTKSELLQLIAGEAIIALATENLNNQNQIVASGCIPILMALLRRSNPPASQQVVLVAVRALASLCIDIAHQPNRTTQKEAIEINFLPLLCRLMKTAEDQLIQVEIAKAIANLSLSSRHCQALLARDRNFTVDSIVNLLSSKSLVLRLKASVVLSTLAYKNRSTLSAIKNSQGICWEFFEESLTCDEDLRKANAAFDAIILMESIHDADRLPCTVRCIQELICILQSSDTGVQAVAAGLTASLANVRGGIPDAMIEAGVVHHLVVAMAANQERLADKAAVAIGILSGHPVAMRLLLSACRYDVGLYEKIRRHLKTGRLSLQFVKEWEHQRELGLPRLSLATNQKRPMTARNQSHMEQAVATAERPETTKSTRRCPASGVAGTVSSNRCQSTPNGLRSCLPYHKQR